MKKDNEFVKNWIHKIDDEPHLEGTITPAGWDLLKATLTDSTYNKLVDELKAKIDTKKSEINKEIDDHIQAMKDKKFK